VAWREFVKVKGGLKRRRSRRRRGRRGRRGRGRGKG
jgi:hypothetical protein